MSVSFRRIASVMLFALSASSATAATMTFDNFSGISDEVSGHIDYSENGITVIGRGGMGSGPGSVFMADAGVSGHSILDFTMTRRFRAISFQLQPLMFDDGVECNDDNVCKKVTWDNLLIEGFRGGNSVITRWVNASHYGGSNSNTVNLPRSFNGLTSLRLSLPHYRTSGPWSFAAVDNVTLAPVPLPAGLPLAGSALAVLGFLGACKGKKQRRMRAI